MPRLVPIRPPSTSPAVTPIDAVARAIAEALAAFATPPVSADELRPVAAWAADWGLERRGLVDSLRRAGAPLVRVGRQVCCRRSDVVALADRLAEERTPAPPTTSNYAELVASARGRR